MSIDSFRILTPVMKERIVKSLGALLHVRRELDQDVVLYQVDGFYVEVYFTASNTYEARYHCFEGTEELEPYLCAIDISPIEALLR